MHSCSLPRDVVGDASDILLSTVSRGLSLLRSCTAYQPWTNVAIKPDVNANANATAMRPTRPRVRNTSASGHYVV